MRLPIKDCLRRHLTTYAEDNEMLLGCGSCPAITKHIEVFGLRHQRRVPVSETGHRLVFKDEKSGKTIETTTKEWRCVERLGQQWFTKKINGDLFIFDLYTARNMGIDGAFPKTEKVAMPKSSHPTWDRLTAKRDMIRAEEHAGRRGTVISLGADVTPSRTTGKHLARDLSRAVKASSPPPKPKKTLSDMHAGSLISDEARKMAKRREEIDSLRKRHVAKFTKH